LIATASRTSRPDVGAAIERSKIVVQVAANPRKLRKEGEQKGEKRLAVFCHNLLLFSGLRRLRQDLANLALRL
jgi:hypothetical protein